MRLYPVAYTVENKYSGTEALILSKFFAVVLEGGGREEINKAENLVPTGWTCKPR